MEIEDGEFFFCPVLGKISFCPLERFFKVFGATS